MSNEKELKDIAIALISQYGEDAEAVAMLRAAEYAAELNNEEWLKWERVVSFINTIDQSSHLDG
jgi:hypothetical protein|tara:strand:- start:2353 stop:2544 length:192 start_codon:yes stop_codon:yes gene_type:complete